MAGALDFYGAGYGGSGIIGWLQNMFAKAAGKSNARQQGALYDYYTPGTLDSAYPDLGAQPEADPYDRGAILPYKIDKTTGERSIGAPNAWNESVELFKAPGEAARGIPQSDDKGSMLGMALLGAGSAGGLTSAVREGTVNPGTAGMFMGASSKNANLGALAKAQKMESAIPGVGELLATGQYYRIPYEQRAQILNETGWFRNVDGQWRYEISNKNTKINPRHLHTVDTWWDPGNRTGAYTIPNQHPNGAPIKLNEVLDDPELFKAYPYLNEVTVRPQEKAGGMTYFDKNGNAEIRAASRINQEELKSILLHETQHVVQKVEGWGGGANDAWIRDQPAWVGDVRPFEAAIDSGKIYNRTSGEVEARATQSRMNMTQEELSNNPVFAEGVPMTPDVERRIRNAISGPPGSAEFNLENLQRAIRTENKIYDVPEQAQIVSRNNRPPDWWDPKNTGQTHADWLANAKGRKPDHGYLRDVQEGALSKPDLEPKGALAPAKNSIFKHEKWGGVGDYATWEKTVDDLMLNEANKIVDSLKASGVKVTPEATDPLTGFRPYVYTNNIGGKSVYIDVPHYGQVRISDHYRSSGLGNDRTFGSAEDALSSIRKRYSERNKYIDSVESLRKELKIKTKVSGKKENIEIIKHWLSKHPQDGEKKSVGYWRHALNLDNDWEPIPLERPPVIHKDL